MFGIHNNQHPQNQNYCQFHNSYQLSDEYVPVHWKRVRNYESGCIRLYCPCLSYHHHILQTGVAGGKPGFIPGNAGVDYPDFKNIPITDFTCQNFLLPGFYADTFTSCQVQCSTRTHPILVRYSVLRGHIHVMLGTVFFADTFYSCQVQCSTWTHSRHVRYSVLRGHIQFLSGTVFYADTFTSC